MSFKNRIGAVLFWSVIAAAFIGPGTLVTASSAGSKFGFSLAWPLILATLACIVFQEMAARLTLITGKDLSATLSEFRLRPLVSFIPFSVILGCVAYEAGNIQGAVLGLNILWPSVSSYSFILIGLAAALLLAFSAFHRLVQILGLLVAVMGIAFVVVAIRISPDTGSLIRGMIVPSFPAGSDWIILGLIGTTVVPYNLFLGSGISRKESLGIMRFGLFVSIIFGGLISIAILVAGTQMGGKTGLGDLILVTSEQLGKGSAGLVALGLFAAGFTSAVTAPFAAGLIAGGFLRTGNSKFIVRITSISVVILGVLSGILEYRPEAIILAAQAANGLVLPLVTGILWVVSNNPSVMKSHLTSPLFNILAYLLFNVMLMLGIRNLYSGMAGFLGSEPELSVQYLIIPALGISTFLALYIRKLRAVKP